MKEAEKIPQVMRQKYWEEADAEQKIERLRDAVARLCRDMNALAVNLVNFSAHQHGQNGELLTTLRIVNPNANYVQGALTGGSNSIPHSIRTQRERG